MHTLCIFIKLQVQYSSSVMSHVSTCLMGALRGSLACISYKQVSHVQSLANYIALKPYGFILMDLRLLLAASIGQSGLDPVAKRPNSNKALHGEKNDRLSAGRLSSLLGVKPTEVSQK